MTPPANITEHDIRNGMPSDGHLVMLPPLQINHIKIIPHIVEESLLFSLMNSLVLKALHMKLWVKIKNSRHK